jgi:hypothetical protein
LADWLDRLRADPLPWLPDVAGPEAEPPDSPALMASTTASPIGARAITIPNGRIMSRIDVPSRSPG